MVEEDENIRLYADVLKFVCNGEVCGELYRETIRRPREKRSAAVVGFESSTKSGEV